MANLKDKSIFITGASRGIGREFAIRFAKDGAKVAIASKTDKPHPVLEGTIHTVAEEIKAAGGQALALQMDIRDAAQVQQAIEKTAAQFGGIDILINNASAIYLRNTVDLPVQQFDLMSNIILRGSYLCAKYCIPFLTKSANPHILDIVPPLNISAKWFKDYNAYTTLKYAASLFSYGLGEELKPLGIAVNGLWPRTTITTAAIKIYMPEAMQSSRTPAIMADAAYMILTRPSREMTGNFFIDEYFLQTQGITDFSQYAIDPARPPQLDLYID